jgi:hypothetical protein
VYWWCMDSANHKTSKVPCHNQHPYRQRNPSSAIGGNQSGTGCLRLRVEAFPENQPKEAAWNCADNRDVSNMIAAHMEEESHAESEDWLEHEDGDGRPEDVLIEPKSLRLDNHSREDECGTCRRTSEGDESEVRVAG